MWGSLFSSSWAPPAKPRPLHFWPKASAGQAHFERHGLWMGPALSFSCCPFLSLKSCIIPSPNHTMVPSHHGGWHGSWDGSTGPGCTTHQPMAPPCNNGKEGGCGRAWARMSCAVPEEASSDPKRTLCPSCKAPPVYIIPYPTLPAGGRRWDPPSLTASAVRPQ